MICKTACSKFALFTLAVVFLLTVGHFGYADLGQNTINPSVESRGWTTIGKIQAYFKAKGVTCCPYTVDGPKTIIISISAPGVLRHTIKYDKFPNWPEVDVSFGSGVHWHAFDDKGNYNLGNYASPLGDIFVERELARYYDPEKPMLGKPAQETFYYEVRPGRGVLEIAPLVAWGRGHQFGWLVETTLDFSPGVPKPGESFAKVFIQPGEFPAAGSSSGNLEELGDQWIVSEIGGWKGVWARRPGTGIFDAVWKNGAGNTVTDTITVESFNGKKIILNRAGNKGKYQGTISDSGLSVSGTASWTPAGSTWTATIQKGGKTPASGDIAGRYIVYSGGQTGTADERKQNYRAVFEISRSVSGYEGRLKFDIFPDWEKLGSFRYENETITFTRLPYLSRTYSQYYSFEVSGDKLDGLFWQDGDDRRWRTWGEREK